MDSHGNIEVKKLSQYNVYAKPLGEETAISDEICKNPNMTLDSEKQLVFDIRKFEQNVNREVRKAYPNIAKLENQCIMALSFSKPGNILHCPSWVMIINIVAMDMLRSRLPIGLYVPNIKNRPRLPVPEEDPYSLTGAGSGTSSGGSSGKEKSGKDKPPKLPPRDNPSPNKSSSKPQTGKTTGSPKMKKLFLSLKPSIKSLGLALDSDFTESPYSHIYGRLPYSNRPYMNGAHAPPQGYYAKDWD
ncbi:hypothetical protein Avbf_02056 [Armadillidium vulgare]|nr:hypothetical protein Avbf_02056 [Armadillidium vulgare]